MRISLWQDREAAQEAADFQAEAEEAAEALAEAASEADTTVDLADTITITTITAVFGSSEEDAITDTEAVALADLRGLFSRQL